jgi:hypothetical protein
MITICKAKDENRQDIVPEIMSGSNKMVEGRISRAKHADNKDVMACNGVDLCDVDGGEAGVVVVMVIVHEVMVTVMVRNMLCKGW